MYQPHFPNRSIPFVPCGSPMSAFVFQVQVGRGYASLRQNYIYKKINIVAQLFRCIIHIVLYFAIKERVLLVQNTTTLGCNLYLS